MKTKIYFIILILFSFVTSCQDDNNNDADDIVKDIDGNIYKTVTIGSQTWMVENLKTTRYLNGDLIGTTNPPTKNISGESSPKYQWAYGGDENNVATYGRLYTWFAITDKRKIAPKGWHIPTSQDWKILEDFLGGRDIAAEKLKESNENGFAALPGGYYSNYGYFYHLGTVGFWWSYTEQPKQSDWYYLLTYKCGPVAFIGDYRNLALSVRCIKD